MPGLWICLIILNVQQTFENASGSKYGMVVSKQSLHRVLNMSEYDEICINNAWIVSICLNIPKLSAWLIYTMQLTILIFLTFIRT